jgi:uncharacterized protein (DUF2062 family)
MARCIVRQKIRETVLTDRENRHTFAMMILIGVFQAVVPMVGLSLVMMELHTVHTEL